MTGIKRIGYTLPKTGTNIIKFMDGEKLMSKVITPGPRNTNPYRIKNIITNYENQKPSKININFEHYMDAIIHNEAIKYLKSFWKSVVR